MLNQLSDKCMPLPEFTSPQRNGIVNAQLAPAESDGFVTQIALCRYIRLLEL